MGRRIMWDYVNLGSGLCLAPGRSGPRPGSLVAWGSGAGTFANRSEQKRRPLLSRLGVSPGSSFCPVRPSALSPPCPPRKRGGRSRWSVVAPGGFCRSGKKRPGAKGGLFFPGPAKPAPGVGVGKGLGGGGCQFFDTRSWGLQSLKKGKSTPCLIHCLARASWIQDHACKDRPPSAGPGRTSPASSSRTKPGPGPRANFPTRPLSPEMRRSPLTKTVFPS